MQSLGPKKITKLGLLKSIKQKKKNEKNGENKLQDNYKIMKQLKF